MSARVLIVEDDVLIALGERVVLENAGFTVVGIAVSEEEAVTLALDTRPDAVLSDIRLARGDGVSAARRYVPDTGCALVFLSGQADLIPAMVPPPCLYATKPITPNALVAAITLALQWKCDGMPPHVLPSGVTAIE